MYDGSAHPDEIQVVEARQQTEHKLAVSGRYFGTYPSVLAQAMKSGKLDASHVTIVDAFAGAGLHASANHPDGVTPGTALQAVHSAYGVQRRFPRTRVHVRLIDIDSSYCDVLEERVQDYVEGPGAVDVRIVRGPFESKIDEVLREIKSFGGAGYSLWFVDPYNLIPIPMSALRLIGRARNTELIVNLDSGGVARMYGVVRKRAIQHAANAARLTDLYGSSAWRGALSDYAGDRDCDAFADAYGASMPTYFPFGRAYALRSSESQFRHLIHFSRHPTAQRKFTEDYEATQRLGIMKGRALTEEERARAAEAYYQRYRGTETPIALLYEAQMLPLDRAQIATVLRRASLPTHGFGEFDEAKSIFRWFEKRNRPTSIAPRPRPERNDAQASLFDVAPR